MRGAEQEEDQGLSDAWGHCIAFHLLLAAAWITITCASSGPEEGLMASPMLLAAVHPGTGACGDHHA